MTRVSSQVINLSEPSSNNSPTTKAYVDGYISVVNINTPNTTFTSLGLTYDDTIRTTLVNGIANISSSFSAKDAYDKMMYRIFSSAATKILDVYIADNITDTSTVATVPGVVPGGTPLTAAGAAAGFSIKTNPINGRKCFYSTDAADRVVRRTTGVVKDCIIVYKHYGAINLGGGFLCSIASSVYPLQVNLYNDQWRVASVGNPVHYLDGYSCNSLANDEQLHVLEGVISENSTAGLRIGGFEGYNFSVTGEIYAIIAFTSVLTTNERFEITNALHEYYQIQRPKGLFLGGNSLVAGYPDSYNWIRAVTAPNIITWNFGVAGYNLPEVYNDMSTFFASKDYTNLKDCIFFLYEDVNSLYDGYTDTQVVNYNWQIAEAARNAGMKVILSTCMPAATTLTGQAETYRQSVNTIKRAQWQNHADYLIDWAGMPQFSDSTNVTFFRDQLHLTDYGYWLMGIEIRKVIASLF